MGTEKPKLRILIFLTLLAVVFAVALTFATVEIPRILSILLAKIVPVPDVNPGIDPGVVEEVMKIARPIGYGMHASRHRGSFLACILRKVCLEVDLGEDRISRIDHGFHRQGGE